MNTTNSSTGTADGNIDMNLVVSLIHIENYQAKVALEQKASEGSHLDFLTILNVCRHVATSDNQDADAEDILRRQATLINSKISSAKNALRWLFAPHNGNRANPFVTTLEKLGNESQKNRTKLRQLFKEAIAKEEHLHCVSLHGIMCVKEMQQLLFVSKHFHANDLPGKIFAKGPCTRIFGTKTAYFAWKRMQMPDPEWKGNSEELKIIVLMTVIAERTDEGELRYCRHELTKEERPQPRLINDMMRKLYINKKYKKDFDTMTTNPLPSSKEWVPVEKELREWLKALCTTNEGKQRLALMPIPLCVCEVTGLIYTQMWYKMERQMIEDLRYYLPGVPVEFPAESCPVCFETFKVEGNDDNGDSDEDSVVGRVMDCGHKICEACFNQCKSEPGGASGTMRQKCPICRTKTYLRELFDRNMFEAWYNKRTGGKGKLTAKQMEPLYAMVGSPGYFLLQGGPGVGKSETAGMFTEWESEMRQKHPHAAQAVGRSVFVAPTGAAAKNVGDRLDRDKFQVNTVHTWLLSLHKRRRERREMHRTGHFSGDVELPVPFLFVDEAGMLGLWMTSLVLREARTSGIERIMFIGDRFQLPPVGTIGSLFASCCLTESKRIKSRVFSLTENFRSDVKGINDMLKNIKNVMQNIENGALNHGDGSAVMGLREECFQGKAGDKSIDLIKIKGNAEKSQEQILDGVLKVLCELEEEEEDTKALSSKKGGLLSDTTCVISSKRKRSYLLDRKWLQGADETAAGKYLKILHMMNGNRNKPTPRKKENDPTCKRDIGKFVKGDRVMCLENISVDGDNANPRKLVLSNGSQGHVVSVTYNDYNRIKSMVVKFDGQEISYPISEWYTKSEYYVKPTDTNGTAADEKGAGSNGNGDGHRRRGTKRKRTIDDVNAYNESQFSKLFPDGVELASVQTVHKYQGSQQDNVVVVMYNAGGDGSTPDTHNTLNLLYTAASRARKRVRFVMDEKTLKHFWEKPTIAKQDVQLIELLDAIK